MASLMSDMMLAALQHWVHAASLHLVLSHAASLDVVLSHAVVGKSMCDLQSVHQIC